MVMRIAIVGGTGTLGKHVVAELAGRGHEVRVLSRGGEYRVDLTTGDGLDRALDGCAAVVDASNTTAAKRARLVLVEGSRRLLAAEQAAGVGHHVCVSIVGCDQVPMGYYKVKVDQEHVVETGPVPWSIVQATQFHELAASMLNATGKYLVLPVPRVRLQTVASAEVARAVADVAAGAPLKHRLQVAGPQVNTLRELALTWRQVTGRRALLVPLPVPGKLGRALRDGGLTAANADFRGTEIFAEWLAAQQPAVT
jgi:uncharacterized protein YbjT (DUF2867 family)